VGLSSPAFEPPSGGIVLLSGLSISLQFSASGEAGYFRVSDGSGVCHVQGTCTAVGGDIPLGAVIAGSPQPLTQFGVVAPGA
jgi:hypothetical protein